MAKQLITMTNGGLQGWVDELEQVADKLPSMMLTSLKSRQEVMEKEVLNQWIAIGGSPTDIVGSSIGQSSEYSKLDKNDVVGTVGVYHIDSVYNAIRGGRNIDGSINEINAPQIAYWVELGSSRLKEGGKKQKGKEYPADWLLHREPRPFISTAGYSSWNESDKAFNKKFNEEYERLIK